MFYLVINNKNSVVQYITPKKLLAPLFKKSYSIVNDLAKEGDLLCKNLKKLI